MADKLREVVAGNNYFLDFGLLGSKTVPAMLTKYGYIEDVMKMITKTEHLLGILGRDDGLLHIAGDVDT